MNTMFIVASLLAWLAILVGSWLSWQLLRQNGRILLRLDELERRLNELEFGEPVDGFPDEGEARHSVCADVASSESGAQGTDAPYQGDRANRFRDRSLARSKIKRDGLDAGTPAPDFRLPRLDGKGDLSLSELRGKRILLVFSSPDCGPCNALAPELEKYYHEQTDRDRSPAAARVHPNGTGLLEPRHEVTGAADGGRPRSKGVAVVMISKGEPKENRAKVKEHGLTFPIVLQRQWEISRRYAMFATPIAYLIDEEGVIAEDVAVGTDAIADLMVRTDPLGVRTPVPA